MANATYTEVINAANRIIREKQRYNPVSTFTDQYGMSVSGWFIPDTRERLNSGNSMDWVETMLTVDGSFCEITCRYYEQSGPRRFLESSSKAVLSFRRFDAFSSGKTADELLDGLERLFWRLD